jgi:hypothetical protein
MHIKKKRERERKEEKERADSFLKSSGTRRAISLNRVDMSKSSEET